MNPAIRRHSGTRCELPGLAPLFRAAVLALCVAAPALLAQSGTQELRLTIGKSVVIDYPSDIARISTSNPDVVDAVGITLREILINGKANGQSTLVVWSKSGERSFFSVTVDSNLEPIQKLLKETFPDESIEVRASGGSASLNGKVSNQAVADRALALVLPMVKVAINNLQVAPGPIDRQIILHVKFASLDRSKQLQLGFNLLSTGATNTIGRITTGQYQSASPTQVGGGAAGGSANSQFSISNALNIFAFRPDLNLGAMIEALQSESILQILAEPNLVTTNGKEASFLAGGEFPVPILQGGGNSGSVTVQFREYGIRLNFLPIYTPNGTIKMHIKHELSTIDLTNAVVLSGFTIPALSTRRAETDVELGAGQSFAIAGLMDERAQNTLNKMPGLANIPILGALFQSKNTQRSKTELIVLVTPEQIMPYGVAQPKPSIKMPMDPPLPDNSPGLRQLTGDIHPVVAKP